MKPDKMPNKRLSITVGYRDDGPETLEALDTRFADGMYVIRHTERVCSMIPMDRIYSITEEVLD